VANDKQREQMEVVIKAEDWEGFKDLIKKVIGTKLN